MKNRLGRIYLSSSKFLFCCCLQRSWHSRADERTQTHLLTINKMPTNIPRWWEAQGIWREKKPLIHLVKERERDRAAIVPSVLFWIQTEHFCALECAIRGHFRTFILLTIFVDNQAQTPAKYENGIERKHTKVMKDFQRKTKAPFKNVIWWWFRKRVVQKKTNFYLWI